MGRVDAGRIRYRLLTPDPTVFHRLLDSLSQFPGLNVWSRTCAHCGTFLRPGGEHRCKKGPP